MAYEIDVRACVYGKLSIVFMFYIFKNHAHLMKHDIIEYELQYYYQRFQ